MTTQLIDTFGRIHDSLRVSVTDRCNIRCFYFMPESDVKFQPREQLLSFEEIERFVSIAAKLGVRKLRLTGGEPLLRKNLPTLVKKLAAIDGIEDLALTTNGVLLAQQAGALYEAGLRRIRDRKALKARQDILWLLELLQDQMRFRVVGSADPRGLPALRCPLPGQEDQQGGNRGVERATRRELLGISALC